MLADLWVSLFSIPTASLVTHLLLSWGRQWLICDIHPKYTSTLSSLSTCVPRPSCTEQPLAQIPQRLHKILSGFNLSRNSVKICPIKLGNQEQQVLLIVVTISRCALWCKSNTRLGVYTKSSQSLIPVSSSALGKDHLPPQTFSTPLLLEEVVAPLWCWASLVLKRESCCPESGMPWVTLQTIPKQCLLSLKLYLFILKRVKVTGVILFSSH